MSQARSDAAKDRLYDEFSTVVADTEQLLRSLATAGNDKAGAMKTTVEQGLAAAGERLAKIREDSMRQADAAVRATDDYVHDNPWQAVGAVAVVAGVAGIVLGMMISRR